MTLALALALKFHLFVSLRKCWFLNALQNACKHRPIRNWRIVDRWCVCSVQCRKHVTAWHPISGQIIYLRVLGDQFPIRMTHLLLNRYGDSPFARNCQPFPLRAISQHSNHHSIGKLLFVGLAHVWGQYACEFCCRAFTNDRFAFCLLHAIACNLMYRMISHIKQCTETTNGNDKVAF